MASEICVECGKRLTFFGRALFFGKPLCGQCRDRWRDFSFPQLAKRFFPNESLLTYGIAYWDDVRSLAATPLVKCMDALVLGVFGLLHSRKMHRGGVVAVTDRDLLVVDLGNMPEDTVFWSNMTTCFFGNKASVKRAPLGELRAECAENVLCVKGALTLTATFPSQTEEEPGNPAKALEIANIIQEQGRGSQTSLE